MDVSLAAIVPHREAAIALAADRLADGAGMAYEEVKTALAAREALGSTALGRGVAMPHAIARQCQRPAGALIRLAAPVDFDAPDDNAVDVVLALIWPQSRVQDFVRFSSLVNRILLDPGVLPSIRSMSAPDRIRSLLHTRARAAGLAGLPHGPTAGDAVGLPQR